MHTNTVPAVKVDSMMDSNNGGEYKFASNQSGERVGLTHRCPGCKTIATLFFGVSDVPNGIHRWQHDGNDDLPTLTPSIHHQGCWHGWLTKGVFKSC